MSSDEESQCHQDPSDIKLEIVLAQGRIIILSF